MVDLLLPNAADTLNAFQSGQQAGMTQRKYRAQQAYGQRLMTGDAQGAAEAIAGVDPELGLNTLKYGKAQEAEGRAAKFRQALAAHDLPTASQLAAGDPDLHKLFGDYVTNTATTLATYVQPLKGLPPDQAQQKYQTEVLPRLHAMGFTGPEYDTWQPTPEAIQQVETTALGLKEQFDRHKPVTVGQNLVDPVTGKPVYRGPDIKAVNKSSGGQVLVDASQLGGAPSDADGTASPSLAPTPDAAIPQGGIYATVGQIASKAGAKPEEVGYLQRLAQVESHGDPSAQNGRSTGLFQFHPDTFAAAGGAGDIHDVGAQTQAALNLSRRDRANLQQLGIEPTDANTYILHQQGAAGGRTLLTSPPEVNAVAALTPIYGSEKLATKAIVNNGGAKDMTAGQFVDMWRRRWANGGAPVDTATAAPAVSGGKSAKQPGVIFDSDSLDNEDTTLTDDTVNMAAGIYLKTGVMPALGMKSTAARTRILNAANRQAKDLGLTSSDIVAGMSDVKAQAKSLADNETRMNQVKGFEDTATKNADLALSLAPKGGAQGGVPVINRWIQAGRKKVAGDPDVAAFDLALGTFADEYAKVVAGQNGATDSVRNEAYNRINGAMTQQQLQKVVATMKQEMANRTAAMADVSEGIRTRIRTGGALQVNTAPAAAPSPGQRPPLDSFFRH